MDFAFMGGSMGSVVGEKFSRACDAAAERGVPLVSVTASGGARMQEGILSLMQLPKTVCAVEDLHDAGLPMISVMAHPTTAGVLAQFASLGDVIVAEPGALLAFTGPRVVQQTTREKLPEDFGLAEQNLRFGHIDAIVPRPELETYLARLLQALRRMATDARAAAAASGSARLRELPLLARRACPGELERLSASSSASQADADATRRSGARSSSRATRTARTRSTTSSGCSTTGSSCTATAAARTIARSSSGSAGSTAAPSRSSATRRAATSRSALDRNFGMAYPEGYRKAMRVMEIAERHRLPADLPRRHAGRLSGRRRGAARPGRRDRPLAGRDGAARRSRSSPASSARAAPAARSRSRSPTAC